MAVDPSYYNYLYFRQNARNRAYLYRMNIYSRIQNIAQHVASGGHPDDPVVKDDYFYLVTELGEDVFREELGRVVVQLRENSK